jgi:6-phosphofructokinase 2
MPTIATVTFNPSVDESTTVERVVSEHKMRCEHPRYDPGGGGINVARAMRRLGCDAIAVYPSGGPTGALLDALLDSEGVPRRSVAIAGTTRINLHVEETASGAQFRFNMPGPELAECEWRACLDAVRSLSPPPEWVVGSGSLPPDAPPDLFAQLAGVARDLGARCVVDTSGEPLRLALAAGVFLVKPNRREIGQLVCREVVSVDDAAVAARQIVREGSAAVVVVSMAADGVLAVDAAGAWRCVPPPVRALSTVGAGDCTVAGIVARLSAGSSLREAAPYGVASGTSAVLAEGTQLCHPDDVNRLLAQVRVEPLKGAD